jgi:hypothetical protein
VLVDARAAALVLDRSHALPTAIGPFRSHAQADTWAPPPALLGPVAYVDIDGTIVPTDGQCKAGMDISYKGIRGYGPA